jgi:hypothetical protein
LSDLGEKGEKVKRGKGKIYAEQASLAFLTS